MSQIYLRAVLTVTKYRDDHTVTLGSNTLHVTVVLAENHAGYVRAMLGGSAFIHCDWRGRMHFNIGTLEAGMR